MSQQQDSDNNMAGLPPDIQENLKEQDEIRQKVIEELTDGSLATMLLKLKLIREQNTRNALQALINGDFDQVHSLAGSENIFALIIPALEHHLTRPSEKSLAA